MHTECNETQIGQREQQGRVGPTRAGRKASFRQICRKLERRPHARAGEKHEPIGSVSRLLPARREAGDSLRDIAADEGVSHQTVANRCQSEPVITGKVRHKRTVTGYRITQYTKPETAAAKIRATFGPG